MISLQSREREAAVGGVEAEAPQAAAAAAGHKEADVIKVLVHTHRLLLLLLGLLIPARLARPLGVSEWIVGLEECGIDVALRT